MSSIRLNLKVGDWVEVRPAAEILQSLDAGGDHERMPFMAEMAKYTGQRFQVSAAAHKTCDTVHSSGGRSVANSVHLADLRCDGKAHGGCQATCLLFWKHAWVKPVDGPAVNDSPEPSSDTGPIASSFELLQANASTKRSDGVEIFRCQATTLPQWSEPLKWWDVRQYLTDIRSGNASVGRVLSTVLLAGVFKLRRLPFAHRFNCWLYERMHQALRGTVDPHVAGKIPKGVLTPDERSDLQVGEIVEVRSREEIVPTLNLFNRNRGLQIDEEMTRYCGGRFKVTNRVTQIINEKSGEMMNFKNPNIVLDNVNCLGEYSDRRLLCPRRITCYWREIWLKRVSAESPDKLKAN